MRELTVLAVEADTRPQIVHNLEVADAHTYFAGEFEAWGHNISFNWATGRITKLPERRNRGCKLQPRDPKTQQWRSYGDQTVYADSVPDIATGAVAGMDDTGSCPAPSSLAGQLTQTGVSFVRKLFGGG